MATYLIFNEDAYTTFKGSYGRHSKLKPRLLVNLTEYAVGVEVLEDPEYGSIYNELSLLPQRELSTEDFYEEQHD